MSEIGEVCSHGVKWACHCRECDLVSARELVSHWGEAVDAARKTIAEAATKRIEELKKTEFEL